jgi:hypothetical protein
MQNHAAPQLIGAINRVRSTACKLAAKHPYSPQIHCPQCCLATSLLAVERTAAPRSRSTATATANSTTTSTPNATPTPQSPP